ncbi:succinate dehydrogenase, cytochrome b556 subunit [uncultured Thiohalocapsa sp.]|jgi:succinate dehydrogenase / fumarate reductase cytochrome b subunit|uniref:succinate dehydrogenase, cytochrome b556 subunit n=1 Tax=uncultured Thiohalocapsa sp. TaxID=768990 RepID=UPI0025EAA56E|nr:succinate dehydrogenase, cytochrome b556 subunit [uncultured Thiohalocapsa sp.]
MTTSRPVFLELWHIRLPIPAVVSILHRISGVLMVLSIPVFAWLFAQALASPAGFAASAAFLTHPLVQLGLLVMAWALLHHLIAGIRYLVIDLGIGVDRPTARSTAWTALTAALALTVVVAGGMLL